MKCGDFYHLEYSDFCLHLCCYIYNVSDDAQYSKWQRCKKRNSDFIHSFILFQFAAGFQVVTWHSCRVVYICRTKLGLKELSLKSLPACGTKFIALYLRHPRRGMSTWVSIRAWPPLWNGLMPYPDAVGCHINHSFMLLFLELLKFAQNLFRKLQYSSLQYIMKLSDAKFIYFILFY